MEIRRRTADARQARRALEARRLRSTASASATSALPSPVPAPPPEPAASHPQPAGSPPVPPPDPELDDEPPEPPVPPRPPSTAVQVPASHCPREQGAPSGLAGLVHPPLAVMQLPATWHSSMGVQVTGSPERQMPFMQVSPVVHGSPLEQGAPSVDWTAWQVPVEGSQVLVTSQAPGVQTTGLLPTHTPAMQRSVCVQASPSSQSVPSDLGG